ncbi:MAG: hypothetical protein U1G07_22360 [Verrucomicrobiota bacterium]
MNFINLASRPQKPGRIRLYLSTVAALSIQQAAAGVIPCRIQIVEKGSGWPVPLVELKTTHHVRFVSDNAGVIAFDLPELLGRETWFDVAGNGYEVPRDDLLMAGASGSNRSREKRSQSRSIAR